MNQMFRSATFKLTMWYLAIVMAISLLFSFILYHDATAELATSMHRETQRIFTQFPIFQNSPLLRPGQDYAEAAHHLLLRLLGFNILVLTAAGLASYLLAKRTLSPIEQAHAQQKRFTADVSHELRTPLTALRMESEVALLNPNVTAKDMRQTLQSNLEEVTKLENLINNLLRLTRLEEAELRYNFSTVSIQAIGTTALTQVAKIAVAKQISLTNEIIDGQLLGDYDSLVQLLVLLLENAIKYSPEQSSVQLKASSDTKQITVEIIDQGIGIEPEALEHIFERFYRADSSRNKAIDGHGLGLSIAKMIADVHHGNITLTSQQGVGTTATVTLPAVELKPTN